MNDSTFYRLWLDALGQDSLDLYIAEYGYPDWFDEISSDANEIAKTLTSIHTAAHTSINSLVKESGLSKAAFARRYCIPIRTLEDWCAGKAKCADYIRLFIIKDMGLL